MVYSWSKQTRDSDGKHLTGANGGQRQKTQSAFGERMTREAMAAVRGARYNGAG